MSNHDNKFKRTVCEQLGEDLDAELCKEVQRHLEGCPDCRAQFDSIRKTVSIYRKAHTDEQLPGNVEERLYKVLSLPHRENGGDTGHTNQ
ncbi:MAG: zf-HC2 domain-containing protein [Candidatus Marinimicrobia bacterium]|nr:zf-HC2 domain-containing protein [Candidatus Neomarinimicrobiota bacterium]